MTDLNAKTIQQLRIDGTENLQEVVSKNEIMASYLSTQPGMEITPIDYVNNMKIDKTYVDLPFIQCLSTKLNLIINIYRPKVFGSDPIQELEKIKVYPNEDHQSSTAPSINVVYNGLNVDHYDSLHNLLSL